MCLPTTFAILIVFIHVKVHIVYDILLLILFNSLLPFRLFFGNLFFPVVYSVCYIVV